AETYSRILAEGEAAGGGREAVIDAARRAWGEGFVAEAVDRFCREHEVMYTSGPRHRGLLTGNDMAKWRASYEDALTYDYGRYTVAKPGPWAQSPVFLQQLALLEGFDIAAMDPLGPEFVHTVVEAAKLAYADREAYYGDPAHVDVPMETLLGRAYNDERRKLIGDRASFELRPGQIGGYAGRIGKAEIDEALKSAAGAGEPTMAKTGTMPGDTCHIDGIDRHGNMVSATPSGGWLQSSP